MKIGNYILILSIILLVGFINLFAQPLQDPASHPKFMNPLPIPAQIDVTNGGTVDMYMEQTQQWLGLIDANNVPLNTTVWGYGPTGTVTYPGPTFIAKKNVPVFVNWYNNLPSHFLPVDASLHMAHPDYLMSPADVVAWYAAGNVPTVAHLHGGHTESASDGLPEAWFTQNVTETGNYFVKTNYVYDNDQEAATLWYHDHALGITRLNVYAGLAGFYLLEDNTERKLTVDGILPKRKHDIEIVIQDRNFDDNGQLFWPAYPNEGPYNEFIYEEDVDLTQWPDIFPNEGPSVLAEFFGNYIVVNGTVWPFLDVEPRPYRFRLLNGSDSRFYILKFENGMSFLQIATDDGLLPTAVELTELLIAPGERAEIVVDFGAPGINFGSSIKLLNFGPDEPFKGFNPDGTLSDGEGGTIDPAESTTTGQIMQFNVNQRLKVNRGLPIASVAAGTILRAPLADLGTPATTRKLVLFEGRDEFGRLQPLLGTMADGSLTWNDAITETPMLNDVEIWEVYNATADAHPIHQHLVAFQIINRESFTGTVIEKDQVQHNGEIGVGGILQENTVVLGDDARLPEPNERGWKDTAVMLPGEVTRVIAKYDREGRYVWHCHILSHEDHEMMRPYEVMAPLPDQGIEIAETSLDALVPDSPVLEQNYPNPFNPTTEINFSIPEAGNVQLVVYNTLGQEVITLARGYYEKGTHNLVWDARDNFGNKIPSGVYIYRLTGKDFVQQHKMMLIK
jgi:spore coat protein A, manganese oxidase